MPYRIDLRTADIDATDRLIELGALDVDVADDGAIAALMPDRVTARHVARALGVSGVASSAAVSRDDGSVWVLAARPVQIGQLRIAPAHMPPAPDTLRLIDSAAFGTGLHPTTAMCLEMLQDIVGITRPATMLDVGTGSGILALRAMMLGVSRATATDIDDAALTIAAANADINGFSSRLQLARGGPDAVDGAWPLVLANIVAAPLIEMASTLVRRIGHHGELILSGIPSAVEPDVARAYQRLGMRRLQVASRDGWVALLMRATW